MDAQLVIQNATELTGKISSIQKEITEAATRNGEMMKTVVAKGNALLERTAEMTDSLDGEIATFIREARSSARKMNDRRKVVTQVFDKIRSGFTLMENVLDAKSSDSVIYKLQAKRDEYAAAKLEKQRREEDERQRKIGEAAERTRIANFTKETCRAICNEAQSDALDFLSTKFSNLTLDNAEETRQIINSFSPVLNLKVRYADRFIPNVPVRYISEKEASSIAQNAFSEIEQSIEKAYAEYVTLLKQGLFDKLDSKIAELKEIARTEAERKLLEEKAANAAKEERERVEAEALAAAKAAAKRRKEIAAEEAEARLEQEARLEDERQQREEQSRLEQTNAEMQALFEQKEYIKEPVNAKVSKHIEILETSAFADIIQLWWLHCGAYLPVGELTKKLGFMVKACEKLANEGDIFIRNKNVRYATDIKAK